MSTRHALRDGLAGALLVNALPHTIMGLAGQRHLTPLGGEESSPGTNLAWAGMNAAGATALLLSGGWRSISQADAGHRLTRVMTGRFAMTAVGTLYEATAGRRKRATRG